MYLTYRLRRKRVSYELLSVGRYAISFAFAVALTLALLWSMQRLIAGGNDVLTDPPRGNVLDFIRLKQEETVQKKERKPQKPPKPKEPASANAATANATG